MSIMYHIVRNKYESKNNIVYFSNANDMYLHHKFYTKLSHYYLAETVI